MKILAIDTTTPYLCLALYDNGSIYEYNLKLGRGLAVYLAPGIKRALDALGWKPQDIDYFACGLGPGSFTGVRVGMATIKGLAYSLRKPVVGIPTLDLLSLNAGNRQETTVMPLVDAKRGLFYASIYRLKKQSPKRVSPYLLLSLDDLLIRLKAMKVIFKDLVILGDAACIYKDKLTKLIPQASILEADYWYPKANNIISLAQEKIGRKEFIHPSSIKPIYLYPKECQIKVTKSERSGAKPPRSGPSHNAK